MHPTATLFLIPVTGFNRHNPGKDDDKLAFILIYCRCKSTVVKLNAYRYHTAQKSKLFFLIFN
jgi:hypothetical protein